METIRKIALRDYVTRDLFSFSDQDWSIFDEYADEWKRTASDKPFIEFCFDKLPEKSKESFEKEMNTVSYTVCRLPRKYLKIWCDEHGYDFLTLCRILDDKEDRLCI